MQNMTLLAIAGSLRAASFNKAAVEAMSELAPPGVRVQVYPGLAQLPLFNPDLDESALAPVMHLKQCLAAADGLIIASPEYAHGISGVMKNALDWLVAGEEFISMPVALINTSPRATHAQAALREVVTTMSGRIVDRACVSIPLLGTSMTCQDIVATPALAGPLNQALTAFRDTIVAWYPSSGSGSQQTQT
ncbi:NADPH-dependent FMN reductase [Bowmanella dokdonensis]|uniref:NAD(P)H-dependent oxidoreductase n=1 Tax=Bowmanella dokdonensis TaxID=751969 RepID=A0A939DMB7_9ALTE|nr:NADPH-dependent FMN reductase [Bowmanella dokdonensis]MBN7825113.1 NAD(P)H-dependent oxidoreductase [Bowmanella dokdonensis]